MQTAPQKTPPLTESESWKMFNRMAGHYDLSSTVISAGFVNRWRRRAARRLAAEPHTELLDLATGTGDMTLELFRAGGDPRRVVGLDPAENMMARGRAKIARKPFSERVEWVRGDAKSIPFDESSFDAAIMSFGIRNTDAPAAVLNEIQRVLKPGGAVFILETVMPTHLLMKATYNFYFRHALPWIGSLFDGSRESYRYLNRTVETFPARDEFVALMRNAGFTDCLFETWTLGVVALYRGRKPTA